MTTTDPAVAELIREVLAEELARLRAEVREERVRIADDADLAAFARRVLAVVPASPPPTTTGHRAAGGVEVIERGLLSERQVDRLPRGTARVRLGPGVRLTPLARDRLRRRGISIERDG